MLHKLFFTDDEIQELKFLIALNLQYEGLSDENELRLKRIQENLYRAVPQHKHQRRDLDNFE